MKVFIDSSVIIDHLRQKRKRRKTFFQTILDESEEMFISLITLGEIYSGESATRQEKEIEEILGTVKIIDLDPSLMKEAGKIRRKTKIFLPDAIIAATSLNLNLPLATLNAKDFRKVAGLALYKISSAN